MKKQQCTNIEVVRRRQRELEIQKLLAEDQLMPVEQFISGGEVNVFLPDIPDDECGEGGH